MSILIHHLNCGLKGTSVSLLFPTISRIMTTDLQSEHTQPKKPQPPLGFHRTSCCKLDCANDGFNKDLLNQAFATISATMLILSTAFLLLGDYDNATAALAGVCTFLFAGALTFALASVVVSMISAYRGNLRALWEICFQTVSVAASFLLFMIGLVFWYISRTYATLVWKIFMGILALFVGGGTTALALELWISNRGCKSSADTAS